MPLPEVPSQGGPVLDGATLVVIAGPSGRGQQVEDEVRALLATDWLAQVGPEYGVTHASFGGSFALSDLHTTLDDTMSLRNTLAGAIRSGAVPAPSGVAYLVAVDEFDRVLGEAAGFHAEMTVDGASVVYAVVPRATLWPEGIGETVSHEIIEMLTDPYPSTAPAYVLDASSPWAYTSGELADLCVANTVAFGATRATRVWSNARARRGDDPCVPTAGSPYFGVDVSASGSIAPSGSYPIAIGRSQKLVLTGWADGTVAPWKVTASAYWLVGGFDPVTDGAVTLDLQQTTLDGQTFLKAGESVELTVTLKGPQDAPFVVVIDCWGGRSALLTESVMTHWPIGFEP
jgi:hypothetical protein